MAENALLTPMSPAKDMPGHWPSTKAGPGLRIQNNEYLFVRLSTTDATGSVSIRGRTQNLDYSTTEFNETFTFSGTGTQTLPAIPLTDGWLVGFDVSRASGTLTDGEVVASVHVGRNPASPQLLLCLASGEISDIRSLGMGAFTILYVATPEVEPVDQIVTVTAPAAGAEWEQIITTGETWEIYSVSGTLTMGAAAANRNISIQMDDGGTGRIVRSRNSTAITANQTGFVSGFAGVAMTSQASGTSIYQYFPLPRIVMPSESRIRSITENIQAADQWSAIRIAAKVTVL